MYYLTLLPFVTLIQGWPYPFKTPETETSLLNRRQFDPEEIENIVSLAEKVYALIQDEGNIAGGINSISNAWAKEFSGDKSLPFNNPDNCQVAISAWGGGHCVVQVNPAASSGTTTVTVHDPNENAWEVCWWNSTADVSGKQYWNDPGVGNYMIEWMSKDGSASANATSNNREGCQQAGICNPVINFYRTGYDIQLYTYETLYQGDDYSGDSPGLCQGGDVNQFHKGGALFSYKCAVPCINQMSLPADVNNGS